MRMIIAGSGEISSTEGTTQGDPLAMAMYALATLPIIDQLRHSFPTVQQVWYADDTTSSGSCSDLRTWWDQLQKLGPIFGYHPNSSKTYLVVKEEHEEKAKALFADTNVHITIHGKRHLGTALGSMSFTEEYVSCKVKEWVDDIMHLAAVASSQPHAAYAAFTHGLSSRWNYLSRTIPDIEDLLLPLDKAIHQHLIPARTGREACSPTERELLSLPARLGGLGLINPATNSSDAFTASERITAPLAALIISQCFSQIPDCTQVQKIKREIKESKREMTEARERNIVSHLNPQQQRLMELAMEKGSSSWLTVLPLKEHGFHFHKGEFEMPLA